jgi:hypothetical protein
MAVKKTNSASRVVKGQELEVQHLTEVTDLSPNQARGLLRKHGNDWAKIKDESRGLQGRRLAPLAGVSFLRLSLLYGPHNLRRFGAKCIGGHGSP